MKTIRTIAALRAELAELRRAGRVIGLVPTMGAFHEGHLSLMRHACRSCDVVVVSLFVNPSQFNDAGDLGAYPRDEQRDAALAAELGVSHLFAPAVSEVYPDGFVTTVSVRGITDGLEGVHRCHRHFDGVATVVTKLLNIVAPEVAFFGQKDAQQAAVVKRLVQDLNLPVRIEVCPIVRAPDGLALSSRNVLLSTADRDRAISLSRALRAVQGAVAAGERDPNTAAAAGRAELAAADIDPEYLTLVSRETMEPVRRVEGDLLAVVAARVGSVRLIDNAPIRPGGDVTDDVTDDFTDDFTADFTDHGDRTPVNPEQHPIRTSDQQVATPRGAPTS
jgi:pantoate--beta-alanine ligase